MIPYLDEENICRTLNLFKAKTWFPIHFPLSNQLQNNLSYRLGAPHAFYSHVCWLKLGLQPPIPMIMCFSNNMPINYGHGSKPFKFAGSFKNVHVILSSYHPIIIIIIIIIIINININININIHINIYLPHHIDIYLHYTHPVGARLAVMCK